MHNFTGRCLVPVANVCGVTRFFDLTKVLSLSVFLLGSILPQSAHAYSNKLIQLLEANNYQAAYQWLADNEAAYAYDSAFNEWLAQLAMMQFQYAHAINALERLALLQPDHLGAQLDLVIAYSKAGYRNQARQQLAAFKSRIATLDNLPTKVTQTVALLSDQLATPEALYKWKGLLQVGGGFDSNANLGTSASSVMLNIQGEFPLEQALGPESIASNDAFSFQRAQLAIEEDSNNCYLKNWCGTLIADLSNRIYNSQSDYDSNQLLVGGFFTNRQPEKVSQWLAYGQYANLNAFDRRTSLSFEFNQRFRRPNRWLGYALHLDYSHEADTTLPDSQQYSVTLFTNENNNWRYNWSFAYHNQPERSAGNSYRSRLAASHRFSYAAWLIRSSASLTIERDSQAYSQLLFGNVKRRDISAQLSTNASYKLSSDWAVSLSASYNFNSSSIPLFDRDRLELMATASYIW